MTQTKTSCRRCVAGRRKCAFIADRKSCERCIRLGHECLYDEDVTPHAPRNRVCTPCFISHRLCVLGADGSACERCLKLGREDQCRYVLQLPQDQANINPEPVIRNTPASSYSDNTFEGFTWSDQQSWGSIGSNLASPNLSTHTWAMHLFLQAMEQSVQEHAKEPFDIEDPDLMPTLDDWLICSNYLTRNGTSPPLSRVIDATSFLSEFFQKPAVLRYIMCCWALIKTKNAATEEGILYYNRARKALIRSDWTSSVDMVYAFTMIYQTAYFRFQPSIGKQFLDMAVEMAFELGMDTDPDDSPWLSHLTPRQKEERRRVFWNCFGNLSHHAASSPGGDVPEFNRFKKVQLKPASQVLADGPVFLPFDSLMYTWPLRMMIYSVKQKLSVPPKSTQEILSLDLESSLRDHLLLFHSVCPPDYILSFEDPLGISPSESELFISQIISARALLFNLNLQYQATISVVFRPIMSLAALPSCRPMYLSLDEQKVITNAINQCLEAAWRIYALYMFAYQFSQRGAEQKLPFDDSEYQSYDGHEAFIVFWFVSCKLDPTWLPITRFGDCNTMELRRGMRALLEASPLESNDGNVAVVLKAQHAMLAEMEEVSFTGVRNPLFSAEVSNHTEILGMEVTSIDLVDGKRTITEPFCYLGFLGFEIGGKIQWKGRSEDSWRLFWKLNA
ncbi:hypothetical protein BCR33DRAFT_732348 [Rhizoclosmatium globosum]|uniref:Xylanolytic transcriptional activator regulatory domain-containing protein n=1 Tax=Rhizoclosmatium globosum TaxID=329046 RepID=A0A1Y2D2G6_9FUNG|nr:hypothetical protein BCR33DRAFT_732348 [Rhizoclosmatium globosum]|eukprot:ORY53450.1 hypothetical protein BCR33DRAFT_732348 [Rhizoclosmatium globosum]